MEEQHYLEFYEILLDMPYTTSQITLGDDH